MKLNYERIDPELRSALQQFPELNINRHNVQEVRVLLATLPQTPPSAIVQEGQLSVRTADATVPVRTYRKSARAKQPAVLWIHGGGYIMGSAEDDRARVIADFCDCTVFSVDYRLAPENPFPAGLDDCHASLNWIVEHADELGIDASRLAIGGASAGGGLAASLALRNRDEEHHAIALQLLLYPMLDNLHDSPSGRIENHPIWNRTTSLNAWEMYLDGEPGEAASPYASASRADALLGLPPAYICVGTEDLFCDENIDYALRLKGSGVACELAVFPGMYHGGDSFAPGAKVSRRMQRGFLQALDHALQGS